HFRGPYTAYRTFFHGHTYTGNPLACAVALATLDELPGAIRQLPVAALREALASIRHPAVQEVRALGMMGAVVLRPREPSARVGHRAALAARRHGAIVRNLGDAIVVMPPLTISQDEIGQLARAVEGGIADVLG
ncbi:MAG: aminotransferase class III-fold pyridoxal phosphate-dependent enzyme, partial [Deltaproteobacteria bacterium]|nr:aminotransferase class III-fold pyridoxal phosphate-dependent enzyme [Deltaproteobacteria bacterium]